MEQCPGIIAEINVFSVFGEMLRAMGQTGHHQVDCSRIVGRQWQMNDRRQWHRVFLIVLLALLDKLYSGAIEITDCTVLYWAKYFFQRVCMSA